MWLSLLQKSASKDQAEFNVSFTEMDYTLCSTDYRHQCLWNENETGALCGQVEYELVVCVSYFYVAYRLLCVMKAQITLQFICLMPKDQIFQMSAEFWQSEFLQNWSRCFYTFRRQTEMESFIRPVMTSFVKL